MRYVVLAVASDIEAERLIEDLMAHPGLPLRTPRWGNAVHATVTTAPPQDRGTSEAGHRTELLS
jgi:hypothetical protein